MKLPGVGTSALVIVAGVVIFYVPSVFAQILYLNGSQSMITCTDAFCIELVIISILGILTIILGVFLTVIAYLNRPKTQKPKDKTREILNDDPVVKERTFLSERFPYKNSLSSPKTFSDSTRRSFGGRQNCRTSLR